MPEVDAYRTRFLVETSHPIRRLRLSWYRNVSELAAGDCVRLQVKLSSPHGSANPGGFDYEGWLWRQGISATGYVRKSRPCHSPPEWRFDRLRTVILQHMAPALEGHSMRGIIEALSLGVRQHITQEQWATLRATGTSHLVAISGLHIGLVAGLLFLLVRWLALGSPARRHTQSLAALAAMTGALLYAALAGWALPTQRAVIMAAVFFSALATERDIGATRALAWAALAVLAWHPAAVMAPGFWLSFGAVAWLVWIATLARGPWWLKALWFQLGLGVALMPVTLWFFGQASIVSPLANMVLIPLASLFVPAVLLCVLFACMAPGPGGWLLAHAAILMHSGWSILEWLAQWPLASFHHIFAGPLTLLTAMAGVLVFALPLPLRLRILAPILILPALLGWVPAGQRIKPGHFRVTVLDVGQGLATVVRTRRHTLVYDAGPAYRTGFDAGAMIVVPYLRHVGRPVVDTMMISHGDLDHIGGAAAIARQLTVRHRVGAGSEHPCRAGQHWRWDGVDFDLLYPNAEEAAQATTTNAHSCILRIHSNRASVLFTGDIEAPDEQRVVARAGRRLHSDVIVVPHHGSATSSSPAFLEAVAPRVALVSTGWHNRWHFPRRDVVARYHARHIPLFNTAKGGALLLSWPSPHEPKVTRWRDQRRRFWQLPRPDG